MQVWEADDGQAASADFMFYLQELAPSMKSDAEVRHMRKIQTLLGDVTASRVLL